MARLCYVIIAHHEPVNLLGLLGSLWNAQDAFMIWLDAKADRDFVAQARLLQQFGTNVHVTTGTLMAWGGFSIVETTLRAYAAIRPVIGDISHVVLCSGTHIALCHPDLIYERVKNTQGWLDVNEIALPPGGLTFCSALPPGSRRDNILRIADRFAELPGIGMFVSGQRQCWAGEVILKGSQWHILRQDVLDQVLEQADLLRRTFRDVLVADEHAFQWAVARLPDSPALLRGDHVFMQWKGASPDRLTFAAAAERSQKGHFLFARKAPAQASVEEWADFSQTVLANDPGAQHIRRIARDPAWAQAGEAPPASLAPSRLSTLFATFTAILGAGCSHYKMSATQHSIKTDRFYNAMGPLQVIIIEGSAFGLALVPCVHRSNFASLPLHMQLQPRMPCAWEFVNVPIEGRAFWIIGPRKSESQSLEIVCNLLLAFDQGCASGSAGDAKTAHLH